MDKSLLDQWREDIVGEWRSELAGSDLLHMEPASRFTMSLNLRTDGTAEYEFTISSPVNMPPKPAAPFPIRWELSDDRVLSVWLPIAPMPDIEMFEWTREQLCYDVLAISDASLALSRRRFDDGDIVVLKRINRKEYEQRKAQEYGRLLDAMKQWVNPEDA